VTAGGGARLEGRIYILLPVHNRREVTRRFIEALAGQTDTSYQLVLVDDGSTDGTAAMVREYIPDAIVIQGDGNLWWAGSLQRGYNLLRTRGLASDDVVLIINDDTWFGPEFLASGRAAVSKAPKTLVLAQLFGQDGQLEEVGVHVDWRTLTFLGVLDPAQVNCLSTRGLFLRAEDFLAIGGFHARLLPHYLSDYEFTIRADRRGFALASHPAVRLAYDAKLSGIRTPSTASLGIALRQTLSKRSADNPVYWTTFLLLTCPRRYLMRHLARTWSRYLRLLMSTAR
jgi:GT2 family glycosyltransferase